MKRRLRCWRRQRYYGDAVYGKNYMHDTKPTIPMCVFKCPRCGAEQRHTGRNRAYYCGECRPVLKGGVRMQFNRYESPERHTS